MRTLKVKNTGFLPPILDKHEYLMGGLSGIVFEERNSTGDWRKWNPTEEIQRHRFFDDFGCVSHSGENISEMTFGWFLENGLIRKDDIEWLKLNGYFDENGKLNFDDRALVVLSGTRPNQGNTMQKVWDAARKFGLWPQGSTPFKIDMSQVEYYTKIDFPQKSYELGQEFLKRFFIQYERVTPTVQNLKKALKHSPLHIGIPICDNYENGGIVNSCGLQPAHAVVLTHIDENGIYHIFDSYDPTNKRLTKTYDISFAYKAVISPTLSVSGKKQPEVYLFEKNLKYGDYDNDVTKLCRKLIEEDCLAFNYPPTPLYSINVANGVRIYQNRHKITSWLEDFWYKGHYFGKKTRLVMNGTNNNLF